VLTLANREYPLHLLSAESLTSFEANQLNPTPASADVSEEREVVEDRIMSEADVEKRIDEDSKEFFAVRNLEEAEVYFTNLTDEHQFRLVNKLVTKANESKARRQMHSWSATSSVAQCLKSCARRPLSKKGSYHLRVHDRVQGHLRRHVFG
jgi:hypothetical protein